MTFQFSDTNRTMDIHHVDDNRVYLATQSDVEIRAGEGLPAYSTHLDLPTMTDDQTCQLNEDETAWLVVEDHRNKQLHAKDLSTHEDYVVTDVGPIPATHTEILRDNELQSFNETAQEWQDDATKIADNLASSKDVRKEYMRQQAASEISSSFTSSSLGSTHTYDSRKEDQSNLLLARDEAELASPQEAMVYANNGTEYAYRTHTLAQIKQVCADCSLHIRPVREKLIQKKAEIDSATTVTAVNAVNW